MHSLFSPREKAGTTAPKKAGTTAPKKAGTKAPKKSADDAPKEKDSRSILGPAVCCVN
jgi:hypothetical protein